MSAIENSEVGGGNWGRLQFKQQVLIPQNHCWVSPGTFLSCPQAEFSQALLSVPWQGAQNGLFLKQNVERCCYAQKAQPKSQMLSMCLEHF